MQMKANLQEEIIVVSLFDGIACILTALKRAGIKVKEYHAFEIDKHAMKVAMHNHPEIIQHGSVIGFDFSQFKDVDLLVGGFPCQSFSFAGKGKGFDDIRGQLFFEALRAKNEINPKHFLFENVRMKKEHQDVISGLLGVEPILIDAALVSAQRRKRLFWTNISHLPPQDKGILLKDIVHENTDMTYAIKDGWLEGLKKNSRKQFNKSYSAINGDKAITMTARQYASWNGNFTFEETGCKFCLRIPEATKKGYAEIEVGDGVDLTFPNSKTRRGRHMKNKSNCLTASPGNYGILENLAEFIVPYNKTLQILDKEVQKGKVGYFGKDGQANRVYYMHNKAVTLLGEAGGGAAKMGQYFFGCITPDRINKRQNGQRFNDGQTFYTLTARGKHAVLLEGYIRKLTPIECCRLMNLPDNYTNVESVSNAQQYKMLGNGMETEYLAHIFRSLLFFKRAS